ncbi:hypothetical protein DPMN_160825 [Dreissena polymorpha]|uniref:Uncharacterized protein n=1 Tax=Dreissena polymorpha TaxID=45954 RepID=A0A9D4IP41_DREPO|nr:hypothetical protein DPMN_160825 [Dreissena polymorpha]
MWEMPCDTAPGVHYRNRTFNIMGGDIKKYAENITFNPVSGKLLIPTKSTVTESPVQKISRINTPTKSAHCQIFLEPVVPSDNVDTISGQLEETILYSDSESEESDVMRVHFHNQLMFLMIF